MLSELQYEKKDCKNNSCTITHKYYHLSIKITYDIWSILQVVHLLIAIHPLKALICSCKVSQGCYPRAHTHCIQQGPVFIKKKYDL